MNFAASEIRSDIITALPMETSTYGGVPQADTVYVPPSHMKALRLECNLVIGNRGVGKTFWSSALRSPKIRQLLETSIPDLSGVEVRTGFGEYPDVKAYPDQEVFEQLLGQGNDAYHVWRAVVGRWAAELVGIRLPDTTWTSTVAWVRTEPEEFASLLERANAARVASSSSALLVFDALDRSSSNWQTMDTIIRDLLRVVLSLKRFPRLHAKVFLREDQFAGRPITDFPDSSKLLATRVDLTWAKNDLHGLMWQYFCNSSIAGDNLRSIFKSASGLQIDQIAQVWIIPSLAKRSEIIQRKLFAVIAGQWMGKDRRRGIPYVWSVGHLADGRGRTSPRSFLAAIRAAAEDSQSRYADYEFALHYESIKRGVQKASEIRVQELSEDYPWVSKLMLPLQGITVPCLFETVEERWIENHGSDPLNVPFGRLPPEHYDSGWAGVRRDLGDLGILETMKDGRVNMPDLYRVGFGLGRRGGVKPLFRSQLNEA